MKTKHTNKCAKVIRNGQQVWFCDPSCEVFREARTEAVLSAMPAMKREPDLTKLKRFVTDTLNRAAAGYRIDDDFEHYVFEETMEALFGKDFWDWYNTLDR